MAMKLPQVTKNVLLNKAVWVGVFTTIASMAGLGLVGLVNWNLGAGLFLSGTFIVTLLSVFVLSAIHDAALTPSKKIYHTQNLFGAVAFAIGLPIILGILGVSSISTVSNLASWATIALLLSAVVLLYVGFVVARKVKI